MPGWAVAVAVIIPLTLPVGCWLAYNLRIRKKRKA